MGPKTAQNPILIIKALVLRRLALSPEHPPGPPGEPDHLPPNLVSCVYGAPRPLSMLQDLCTKFAQWRGEHGNTVGLVHVLVSPKFGDHPSPVSGATSAWS